MIIALFGYMGSGKSSVGKVLASIRDIPFKDLDSHIEKKENKSIPELFNISELTFRKKEHKHLVELIQSKRDTFVLSLGGGATVYFNGIQVLKNNQKVISVYLKTGVSHLANRLFFEKRHRPLIPTYISGLDNLEDFIAKHLFERNSFYMQADYVITTDNKTITEVAKEIDQIIGPVQLNNVN